MADTTLELSMSTSVTLDASGNGDIRIGPNSPFERWEVTVTNVGVQPVPPATSVVRVAKCDILRGYSADSRNRIDGTYDGTLDTSTVSYTVYSGQVITVTFRGGDVGAVATVTLAGSRIVKGRRAY